MKNKSLKEIGWVMFLVGLSQIIFPNLYAISTNHHYEYPDNIYFGITNMVFGGIILFASLDKKKNKK